MNIMYKMYVPVLAYIEFNGSLIRQVSSLSLMHN